MDVVFAVAVMCAKTSRTDHWLHCDSVFHCSSLMGPRSVASDPRSVSIVRQIAALSTVPPRSSPGTYRRDHA